MCDSSCVHSAALAIILVGTALLTIFSSELIPGYAYSKDLQQVTCAITNNTFVGNVCCESTVTSISSCGDLYVYPCVLVTAVVNNNTASQAEVSLFTNHKAATRGGSIAWCSQFTCESASYEDRLKSVNEFTSEYGTIGSTHTCYYGNKDNTGQTALLNRVSAAGIAAALTISILLIVSGIIVVVVMCIVDRHRHKHDIETIPPSKENLKKGDEFEDESDIETIDMNTTSTTLSTKSRQSIATNKSLPGSPIKHPHSPIEVEEEKVSSI